MDSFGRSRSLSKHCRSRRESTSKLTPNMAAAMLSLRWPPPEKPRTDEDDIADQDDRRARLSNGRRQNKSKFASKDGGINNNFEDDEPIEYEPVVTPHFNEVQTNWPGFDHEPVPNWEEKYMIAKPYPRNEADISCKSSRIHYGNEYSNAKNHVDLQKRSKSTSKSQVKGARQTNESNMDSNRSRRIIRVERIGSCIK